VTARPAQLTGVAIPACCAPSLSPEEHRRRSGLRQTPGRAVEAFVRAWRARWCAEAPRLVPPKVAGVLLGFLPSLRAQLGLARSGDHGPLLTRSRRIALDAVVHFHFVHGSRFTALGRLRRANAVGAAARSARAMGDDHIPPEPTSSLPADALLLCFDGVSRSHDIAAHDPGPLFRGVFCSPAA